METAMEIALREALERKKRPTQTLQHTLHHVVEEWSADDCVHTDPPLPPPPQPIPPQETSMALQAASENNSTPDNGGASSAVSASESAERNLTRTVFEYIRDHQGVTRQAVFDAMLAQGANRGSVSSLIGQMIAQHMIFQDPKTTELTTAMKEFRPLKSGRIRELYAELRRLELAQEDPVKARGYAKMAETKRKQNAKAKRQQKREAAQAAPATKKKSGLEARQASLARAREVLAERRKDPEHLARLSESLRAAHRRRAAAAETVQVDVSRLSHGVDIDAAHKAAKPLETQVVAAPAPPPVVREIVQETLSPQAVPSLRGMTADEIVTAMTIRQAKDVLKQLTDLFAD